MEPKFKNTARMINLDFEQYKPPLVIKMGLQLIIN